jgi:hypothetical protein
MLGLEILSKVTRINKESPTLSEIDIIFSSEGDYYYLSGLIEDLEEIDKFPIHIKKDWIKANRNNVNIAFLNNYIKNLSLIFDNLLYGTKEYVKINKEMEVITNLRSKLIQNERL